MSSEPSLSRSGRRLALPKYCRHRKPGQQADRAYVTLDGRQIYLGLYGSPESHTEYDRLIAEYLANGRKLLVRETRTVSINELLLDYLAFAEEYYQTEGVRTHEYDEVRYAVRELARLYGLTGANAFGPAELKTIQKTLIDQGLSRTGVNRRISRICRFFRWAVENGRVDPMVHYALKQVPGLKRGRTVAPETEPIRPVDRTRVDAVEAHLSRQVWAMVQLQLFSGMRPGEVCRICAGEIDRSGAVWIYRPGRHKTYHHGHSRSIYFGPKAQVVLTPWLDREPDAYLFSPIEAERDRKAQLRAARKSKVQPSQQNRRKSNPKRKPRPCYDTATYYRAIQRACDVAGVERWHPNQLRHTAATEIRKRHGIELASILLGHREVGVTQIYAERDENRAIEVAAEFG